MQTRRVWNYHEANKYTMKIPEDELPVYKKEPRKSAVLTEGFPYSVQ